MAVKHTFSSGIADDPASQAAGEVLPSHWNANHTVDDNSFVAAKLSMAAANKIVGSIASTGAAVEIDCTAAGRALLAGAAASDQRTTLELGTAATTAATAYATAAQGTKADSALQPASIASGTITARADDINFSGGSDGHVLTVQADGSLALEAAAAGGSGDMLSTLTSAEISITTTATATISRMHVCSGTSADYTLTLPTAVGNAGKFIGVRMSAALTKLVTLDANSTETIDGALTRIMWAGEVAILLSDGANWFKVAGRSIAMRCSCGRTTVASVSSATTTDIPMMTLVEDNSGMMYDSVNGRVNTKRPSSYKLAASFQIDGGTAPSTTLLSVGVRDGSNVQLVSDTRYTTASLWMASWATRELTLPASTVLKAFLYQESDPSINIYSAGPNYLDVYEVPAW